METVYYTVQRLDGDYAVLISDEGVENRVARALLPEETDEGVRLNASFSPTRLLKTNEERTYIMDKIIKNGLIFDAVHKEPYHGGYPHSGRKICRDRRKTLC